MDIVDDVDVVLVVGRRVGISDVFGDVVGAVEKEKYSDALDTE